MQGANVFLNLKKFVLKWKNTRLPLHGDVPLDGGIISAP